MRLESSLLEETQGVLEAPCWNYLKQLERYPASQAHRTINTDPTEISPGLET